MIVQSKSGNIAEKWLRENYRGEYSDFHVISLARLFDKHAEEAKVEQREACAEKCDETI